MKKINLNGQLTVIPSIDEWMSIMVDIMTKSK